MTINGSMEHRLPGNLNMSFLDVDGETLLTGLNDVALSSGSACSSGKTHASYVLKALGLSDEAAGSAIRFGIGRFNTEAEIDYVAGRIIELVKKPAGSFFPEVSLFLKISRRSERSLLPFLPDFTISILLVL